MLDFGLDLDNIELCAKAAPAGPYGKIIGGVVNTMDGRILKDDDTFDHLQNCDPQTILALISLARKNKKTLEAERKMIIDQIRQEIQKIETMMQDSSFYSGGKTQEYL